VECSDRIEAHGAQRRNIAGGERDSGKCKGDATEGGSWVTIHCPVSQALRLSLLCFSEGASIWGSASFRPRESSNLNPGNG
jgi:hypothetical protein